jgi:hypothetical protein
MACSMLVRGRSAIGVLIAVGAKTDEEAVCLSRPGCGALAEPYGRNSKRHLRQVAPRWGAKWSGKGSLLLLELTDEEEAILLAQKLAQRPGVCGDTSQRRHGTQDFKLFFSGTPEL